MTRYGDDPSPTAHLLRTTLRRLKRLRKGSPRQHLVTLGSLAFVFFTVYRVFQSVVHNSPIGPVGILSCDSPRDHYTKAVTLPPSSDVKGLSQLWKTLQSLFDEHPPDPLTLSLKTFKSLSDFPPLEAIKNHTRISDFEAQRSRTSHVEVTKKLPLYPKKSYSGRGIVMLAGGRYSGFATTGLGMLREIGSKLPVEVWTKDRSEEKKGWCKDLLKEGMVCRRLSDYMNVSALDHGYQLKISSIIFSSFEQVLFLDADNVPIKRPDDIFDSPSFNDTGAVLWPDYWTHTGTPLLPYIVGLSDGPSEMLREDQTAESGQLVWDKKRHWKSLCLAAYYNYYGPQHYYTLISQGWAGWGDKDTFPIALRSLRQDYYMVPHKLKTLFVNGTQHGIGMLQADPTNQTAYEPMFLHSNMIKWSIREFLCVGCSSDPVDAVATSALEKPESSINKHLKEHRRIFNIQDMQEMQIDPEPLIWKSMEHTACRSVWKDPDLCARTREHMTFTFGYQFRASRIATLLGYGDQVCVLR